MLGREGDARLGRNMKHIQAKQPCRGKKDRHLTPNQIQIRKKLIAKRKVIQDVKKGRKRRQQDYPKQNMDNLVEKERNRRYRGKKTESGKTKEGFLRFQIRGIRDIKHSQGRI